MGDLGRNVWSAPDPRAQAVDHHRDPTRQDYAMEDDRFTSPRQSRHLNEDPAQAHLRRTSMDGGLAPYDHVDSFLRPRPSNWMQPSMDGRQREDRSAMPFNAASPQSMATDPRMYALPPLAPVKSESLDRFDSSVGKQLQNFDTLDACKVCQIFGALVSELSEITTMLRSDVGHIVARETQDHEPRIVDPEVTGKYHPHVTNFHRSLADLRGLRQHFKSKGIAKGDAGFASPRYQRDQVGPLDAPDINSGRGENPRKRSRQNSPGAHSTPSGSWRPLEAAGRGYESIPSPTSPSARAPPSPTSDISYRQLPQPHLSSRDDSVRRASLVGSNPTSLPPPTFHDDSYVAPPPHISSMSAKSSSHNSSSAESTHYADLQRQITLKTLSLQTLQSEYSSLLQKLHRERLRSQTIERKSSVAEGEINALSTHNEDLSEQVKSLTSQLEVCEHNIATMRSDFNRDKAQWVRMLSNDTKIMGRSAEQRRVLAEEKFKLEATIHKLQRALKNSTSGDAGDDDTAMDDIEAGAADLAPPLSPDEVSKLHQRIAELSDTNGNLRAALTGSQDDNKAFETRLRALMDAITASDERTSRVLSQNG